MQPHSNEPIVVALSKGYSTIVDAVDADLLQYKWCAAEVTYRGRVTHVYAIRGSGAIRGKLHRLIAGRIVGRKLDAREQVDHISGDTLDNRRSNLRIANNQQNCRNQKKASNNTSGFKGVNLEKRTGRWRAQIWITDHSVELGYYTTAQDAAIAYNHAAVKYFGEYARLNDVPHWEQAHPEQARLRGRAPDAKGAYFDPRSHRWMARITLNGKRIFLGSYATEEEAHQEFLRVRSAARAAAERT